jgi:lariat debranching enzyme
MRAAFTRTKLRPTVSAVNSSSQFRRRKMKVAVEGCCHGELDAIYKALANLQRNESQKVDLLLIGGDFQAVRNNADLSCMSVPRKFQLLRDFASYYNGTKKAPVLTIFIGGNHEASNYLHELYSPDQRNKANIDFMEDG